jgi:hypothetical protein
MYIANLSYTIYLHYILANTINYTDNFFYFFWKLWTREENKFETGNYQSGPV